MKTSHQGTQNQASTTRDMNPYTLEIRTSTVEKDDLLFNLAIALGVLYVVLVLSMYLVNLLVINKIWKPFKRILTAIRQYERRE